MLKTLLVTGGTGSFGNAVVDRFLERDGDIKEIRIFSRDEKKQDDMRKKYSNHKLKFYLGDVRDMARLNQVTKGVDYIFHAAALKQVPSCEFYPLEAVKTNILGTENVLESAILNSVEKVVCLSTDKAVYPINAMGISKAMMEKIAISKSRVDKSKTTICVTRYGNVMGTRGSVIPLFINQIKNGGKLTVTNQDMTRFMMFLEEAVDLVEYAFENGSHGNIFVKKSPAATIGTLVEVLSELFDFPKSNIEIIGNRHGEKMHESLLTKEEMDRAEDHGEYYKVSVDARDLNYNLYYSEGDKDSLGEEYNSNNTHRLSKDELKEMLLKLDFVKESLEK